MIRPLLLALALVSLAYPQETADSADTQADLNFEIVGPPFPEELVVDEDLDLDLQLEDSKTEDDLEVVERSTHRLLELVAEQVRRIRPELAVQVDQELENTQADDDELEGSDLNQ